MKTTLFLLSLLAADQAAMAQTPVTAVYTHWTNATTSQTYTGTGATGNASSGFAGNTYTYRYGTAVTTPNTMVLDSFAALGFNFHFLAATPVIRIRRVNNASVTGLRKSLWFEQSSNTTIAAGGTAQLLPSYDDSIERIFSSGQIFNIGIDNNFQNAATTNNNNIERIDFIIPSGVSATDGTRAGFVVFERGAGTTHDPFYIAAIRSLDASGNPSAYYNAVPVVAGNYGNDAGPAFNYLILRKNPADPALLLMDNSSNQNRDGTLLRFPDLGIANNTTVYGYSLFGTDVAVNPATNLVDYTNATNFPPTTDLSGGGLDQVAITGLWSTNGSPEVLADRVLDFSAHAIGGRVGLDWTLGTLDNLKELIVERSGDGINFNPLLHFFTPATVSGSIFDQQPLPGENFYRLQLVNNDGATNGFSTVSAVSIPVPAGGIDLMAYPDPIINGRVTLDGQGMKSERYEFSLIDMNGKVLCLQQFMGSPSLTKTFLLPEHLRAGVYMVGLTDKDGHKVFVKTVMAR